MMTNLETGDGGQQLEELRAVARARWVDFETAAAIAAAAELAFTDYPAPPIEETEA